MAIKHNHHSEQTQNWRASKHNNDKQTKARQQNANTSMMTTQLTIASQCKLTSMASKHKIGDRRHKDDEKTQEWQANTTSIAFKMLGLAIKYTSMASKNNRHHNQTY